MNDHIDIYVRNIKRSPSIQLKFAFPDIFLGYKAGEAYDRIVKGLVKIDGEVVTDHKFEFEIGCTYEVTFLGQTKIVHVH